MNHILNCIKDISDVQEEYECCGCPFYGGSRHAVACLKYLKNSDEIGEAIKKLEALQLQEPQ